MAVIEPVRHPTSPRPHLDPAVREVLDAGLDDWVALESILRVARRTAEAQGCDFKEVTRELASQLLGDGLMIVGELGEGCIDAWDLPTQEAVGRVVEQCEHFDWMPRGQGCWFANTEEGDALAHAFAFAFGRQANLSTARRTEGAHE